MNTSFTAGDRTEGRMNRSKCKLCWEQMKTVVFEVKWESKNPSQFVKMERNIVLQKKNSSNGDSEKGTFTILFRSFKYYFSVMWLLL